MPNKEISGFFLFCFVFSLKRSVFFHIRDNFLFGIFHLIFNHAHSHFEPALRQALVLEKEWK